jgi:hypothetical protein
VERTLRGRFFVLREAYMRRYHHPTNHRETTTGIFTTITITTSVHLLQGYPPPKVPGSTVRYTERLPLSVETLSF